MWGELILNWEIEVKKRPNYIKDLVKRGIPQHFRMIAWQNLSNASVSSVHDLYSDYMRQSSVYEKVRVIRLNFCLELISELNCEEEPAMKKIESFRIFFIYSQKRHSLNALFYRVTIFQKFCSLPHFRLKILKLSEAF